MEVSRALLLVLAIVLAATGVCCLRIAVNRKVRPRRSTRMDRLAIRRLATVGLAAGLALALVADLVQSSPTSITKPPQIRLASGSQNNPSNNNSFNIGGPNGITISGGVDANGIHGNLNVGGKNGVNVGGNGSVKVDNSGVHASGDSHVSVGGTNGVHANNHASVNANANSVNASGNAHVSVGGNNGVQVSAHGSVSANNSSVSASGGAHVGVGGGNGVQATTHASVNASNNSVNASGNTHVSVGGNNGVKASTHGSITVNNSNVSASGGVRVSVGGSSNGQVHGASGNFGNSQQSQNGNGGQGSKQNGGQNNQGGQNRHGQQNNNQNSSSQAAQQGSGSQSNGNQNGSANQQGGQQGKQGNNHNRQGQQNNQNGSTNQGSQQGRSGNQNSQQNGNQGNRPNGNQANQQNGGQANQQNGNQNNQQTGNQGPQNSSQQQNNGQQNSGQQNSGQQVGGGGAGGGTIPGTSVTPVANQMMPNVPGLPSWFNPNDPWGSIQQNLPPAEVVAIEQRVQQVSAGQVQVPAPGESTGASSPWITLIIAAAVIAIIAAWKIFGPGSSVAGGLPPGSALEQQVINQLKALGLKASDIAKIVKALENDPNGAYLANIIASGIYNGVDGYPDLLNQIKSNNMRSSVVMVFQEAARLNVTPPSKLAFEQKGPGYDMDIAVTAPDGTVTAYQLKEVNNLGNIANEGRVAAERGLKNAPAQNKNVIIKVKTGSQAQYKAGGYEQGVERLRNDYPDMSFTIVFPDGTRITYPPKNASSAGGGATTP